MEGEPKLAREREREMRVYICIYIYIYIWGDIERDTSLDIDRIC